MAICSYGELMARKRNEDLKVEDCDKQISDSDLRDFWKGRSGFWGQKPHSLGGDETLESFLFKQRADGEGPRISYKNLINYLLEIKCGEEAERVC